MKKHAIFTLVLALTLLATAGQSVGLSTPLDGASARQRANAAASLGATYYVDQNHAQANDSNPGTESLPWLTIQRATDTVQAGDTVIVKGESEQNPTVYPERVTFSSGHSGSEGNPVVFSAQPRRSVTMQGFETRYADYLTIEGFNITHDLDWICGVLIKSDHVEVIDNHFYDIMGSAIGGYYHQPFPQDAYVAHNQIYKCQKGIDVHGYNWLIEDNEVERLYAWGDGDCDYTRFFGDGIVFRNNHFHGTDKAGGEVGDAHVDCFQSWHIAGQDDAFARDVTFENNVCYHFDQALMATDDTKEGTPEPSEYLTNFTMRNNIFGYGFGAGGQIVAGCIDGFVCVNNTFVNMYGVIRVRGGTAGVIKNNIFYGYDGYQTGFWYNSDYADIESGYNIVCNPRYAGPTQYVTATDLWGVDPLLLDPGSRNFHLQDVSPAIDAGEDLSATGFNYDLEGNIRPQGAGWDIGAYEFVPELELHGAPADEIIHLTWTVNTTLPATTTWHIDYYTQTVTAPFTATDSLSTTRAYTLTGLTNYQWYTVTLHALDGATSILSDTVRVMPTDRFVYLPLVLRGW